MKFLGELHYWKAAGMGHTEKREKIYIDKGREILIPKNSITYILLKEEFRLPEYIGARFNLSIQYIHKGILLGTGPMVQPGFSGRLLIPLHNLTGNNYRFTGGEGLIMVEFTKFSRLEYWERDGCERPEQLKPDHYTEQRDADEYFKKACIYSSGVVSAFKGELDCAVASAKDAKESVEKAKESAKNAEKWARWINVGTLIAIAVFIIAMVTFVHGVHTSAIDLYKETQQLLNQVQKTHHETQKKLLEAKPNSHDSNTTVVETNANDPAIQPDSTDPVLVEDQKKTKD